MIYMEISILNIPVLYYGDRISSAKKPRQSFSLSFRSASTHRGRRDIVINNPFCRFLPEHLTVAACCSPLTDNLLSASTALLPYTTDAQVVEKSVKRRWPSPNLPVFLPVLLPLCLLRDWTAIIYSIAFLTRFVYVFNCVSIQF